MLEIVEVFHKNDPLGLSEGSKLLWFELRALWHAIIEAKIAHLGIFSCLKTDELCYSRFKKKCGVKASEKAIYCYSCVQ